MNMSWFTDSHRWQHFIYAIPCGFLFTSLFAIGLGVGMEFKDHMYGNNFDFIDLLCTVVGGIIGHLIQIGLILLFI
jgi:hypothetical protein